MRAKVRIRRRFYTLYEYIENSDECQFTARELQRIVKGVSGLQETYTDKHLINRLKEHFKDRLRLSNVVVRVNVVYAHLTMLIN